MAVWTCANPERTFEESMSALTERPKRCNEVYYTVVSLYTYLFSAAAEIAKPRRNIAIPKKGIAVLRDSDIIHAAISRSSHVHMKGW
jgi:hypothetical protein